MNINFRFERLVMAILGWTAAVGIIGYYINALTRLAGPIFFMISFVVSYVCFYRLTKKAQAGEIEWLRKK